MKKLNFGLSQNPQVNTGNWIQALKLKSCLICVIYIVPLSVCMILLSQYLIITNTRQKSQHELQYTDLHCESRQQLVFDILEHLLNTAWTFSQQLA